MAKQMEQFEKWYIKNKDKLFCLVLTHRSKQDCEKVWKAALEWVLNNYPDDAIYEIIKKELGNSNK